tara:strand:+ start:5755 stop:7746 length:1992 start_codon:yes stop_codon:yes gene_type:complete
MYKILISKDDISLKKTNGPVIGRHDVLVEVLSSFYSTGTESSSRANIQLSILQKALKYQGQIKNLLKKRDFSTLLKKLNNQLSIESETGYASFGRVIDYGENVTNVRKDQYVICTGPKAIHASLNIVPAGLVFPAKHNQDYAAVPILAIALNSVIKSQVSPGDHVLVVGAGLIGQFILQIYKSMSVRVDVVDKIDSNKELSMSNGANVFYTSESFEACNNEYDVVVNTSPTLNKKDWGTYLEKIKICGNVVLVGAADLNVSRSIFYNKRLNFLTAYSYGAGRSEYSFENGINKSDIFHKSGLSIDELFKKAVYLIDNEFINFDSIPNVHIAEETDLKKVLEDKNLGYFFNWEKLEGGNLPEISQSKASVEKSLGPLQNIDVYGYSNFFKDSHLPALKNLKVKVNNIYTHSPKSDHPSLSRNSQGIIVSTPHGEHLNCIKNCAGYGVTFVDKPVVTNLAEINDYLSLVESNLIIGLMSRRYSDFIALAKTFVNDAAVRSDLYLKLVFNVETKSQQDKIYFEGGRLVGEMIHHLDLAIDLLGEIDDISFFDFDESENKQMSENILIIIRHQSGATSQIEYVTKSSAIFEKEFISISSGESSLAISDFKNIQSKNFKTIKISESDKGVGNMWALFKKKMDNGDDKYFIDLMNQDIYVYKILKHLIG